MKKRRISLRLDMDLFIEIERQAKLGRNNVSELINEILKNVVTSTKSFLSYELIRTKKEYEYAEYQAKTFNNKRDLKSLLRKLNE